MVTLTIDGKQVTVEAGTTILMAAEKAGVEIPTFCFHDKLETVGACRMCLVEVEKIAKLQVACATAVSEGMVVRTDTPQVANARKGVLEFLLINHPLDCPVCDKGGECELQNQVFKYGSDKSRFVEGKRRFVVDPKSRYGDLSIGPQIVRNMNRCILCRKCVRFISEIAGETDLGTFKRGAKTEINVLPDIPVSNPYSGNAVDICPVGALTSKSFRYKIRVWQTKTTPSVCSLCGDGCNVNLWTKDDRIYRITSRRNDSVDEGFLCDKGRFGFGFVNHPDRLKYPLVKKNGKLIRTDWDEAIELAASKLKNAREQFGADSLAGVGSSKLTNEENYVFQKLFRVAIGTNNVDHRINSRHLLPSPDRKDMVHGMVNSISEIERANVIFVLGCDLEREHPIVNLRVIKSVRKGNMVVVANPETTRLKRFAQDELLYKKGTGLAFVNAVTKRILEGQLINAGETGFAGEKIEALRKKLLPWDGEKVLQTIGIEANRMDSFARILANTSSMVILCGKEIGSQAESAEILASLNDLLLLTGHYGKGGCGVNLLWEDCNSQGALDCGVLPDKLPGYRHVSDEASGRKIEQVWNLPVPNKPGFDFNGMLKAAKEGKIKAMYVLGGDPMTEHPDKDLVHSALEKLDFLVVQDIFLTETAKLADVVLPGASFAEKDGTFTNVERRIQKVTRAFDPLADAKPDWYIICMLAQVLGYPFEYVSARQIFQELIQLSPIHSGMNWEDLGGTGKRYEIYQGLRSPRVRRETTV
ncbi:MAG: NADH-quinone oxidoreductase subunit NuoG [Candidatus Zixiibacteriota bacterium]